MKCYVVGFAFDSRGWFAMIEKQHPDWQKGLWNGIGGKIEKDEIPVDAMVREFHEEAGQLIPKEQWKFVGRMLEADHFDCAVFMTQINVLDLKSMTDERIRIFPPEAIQDMGVRYPCLPNIPALLQLCLLKPSVSHGRIPTFTLDYDNPRA
jgi:8-oxo-dGTP diphosphatase